MGQQVDVTADGRIVVECDEGDRFEFQVFVLATTTMRLVDVQWKAKDLHAEQLERLDHARLTASRAAEERGWMRKTDVAGRIGLI